jgi:hypothetical protein
MSLNPLPLNRGMNLQQLIEGQKAQIASLSPNAPVALYHPTDIEGATDLILRKGVQDHYEVLPDLKHAVKHGDVIIQFQGRGKHLEVSKQTMKKHGDQSYAHRMYPDSADPVVTFTLLSNDPMVYFTGLITPEKINNIYVMQDGKPEPMNIQDFMKYAINDRADNVRQQWALTG